MEKTATQQDRLLKLQQLNSEALDFRYQIEDQITDAITEGNKDILNEYLDIWASQEDLFGTNPVTSTDELREMKNQLVICNTYSRIAAKNGGLMPAHLHLISKRYSILIEKAPSIEYLKNDVFFNLFRDYCTAVQLFSTKSYSGVMKEIVSYIIEHLTEEMTLTSVATLFGMHPVHLARKFKQETGTTFIGYVNQHRVYLAMYYFHEDMYQLSEVAYLSGFNSHSYFTKVFKKLTGVTPTEYVKQISLDD
ncbi:helix-turn-helix domain-containing protein [Atopococcus tabaci]|uniref:helix-turn-helix domain-containing protein n=1 Tax=Atopococcus tabaci TaxID=269774 RepID=UPI0024097FE0|nr:helix-turn-helix domain-containing protein [Atopococcus tabaci]